MSDLIGKTLGGYRIIEQIGQGGMATVFKAYQPSMDRYVAFKVLATHFTQDPTFVKRFQQEAKVIAKLEHLHILPVYDYGEEEGYLYLVMRFIEAGTLKDQLVQGLLPLGKVRRVVVQVGSALEYAHHLGVIHRDLKPSNVLIDSQGDCYLTDFGIAKMVEGTLDLTGSGIVGTPHYMSPEQCQSLKVNHRADVYAMGVVIYQMVTGQLPFDATTPLAVAMKHVKEPLPLPRNVKPDLPGAVERVILKALAKEPADRYQSMGELVAAFDQAVQAAQVGAPAAVPLPLTPTLTAVEEEAEVPKPPGVPVPPTPAPAWRHWLAAQPRWRLVAAGLALLVLAGIILSGVLPTAKEVTTPTAAVVALVTSTATSTATPTPTSVPRATPTPTPVPTPTSLPTVEPIAPDEYMVLVAQLEPLGVEERDVTRFIVDDLVQTLEVGVPFSKLRIREYPEVITSEEAALAAAEANEATVMVWGNYTPDFIELEVQLGVTKAFPLIQIPRETLERTVNVRVRMTDERQQSVAMQVLLVLAGLQFADGDAYEMASAAAIRDEIEVTSAEVVGGGVAVHVHRYFEAYVHDTPRAIEEIEAALALDPGNPFLYADRCGARQRLGLFDDGRRDAQTALRLGPDQWAIPLYALGNNAFFLGDLDEAISYFSRVVDLRPDDWFAVNFRGALHYLNGEYDLAKADCERAIALGPKANFPYVYSAMIALREGRMANAAALMKTVLTDFPDPTFGNRIILALYGDEIPVTLGPTFSAFGNLILGQYDAVIRDTEAALAINDQLADLYFMQGFAYCNLQDYKAAEAAYTRGLELDPDFIILYLLRAEVRFKQNNLASAFEDVGTAQASELGEDLAEVIAASQSGALGCENFFSYAQ